MRTMTLVLTGAACAAVALAVGVAMADPTTTTTTASTSPTPAIDNTTATSAAPANDSRGYPATAAYCDDTQTPVASGRTPRALVAICADPDGQLEYRGARLSDLASLTMPAGRTADGAIVATNDGVTYVVSPDMLLVSEGDNVLYRDNWIEFSEGPDSPDDPTESPATDSPTADAVGAPTVSTTTVTLAPDR